MTKPELIANLERRLKRAEKAKMKFNFIYLPILFIVFAIAYEYAPFQELTYFSNAGILILLFMFCVFVGDMWRNVASKIYCEHCNSEFKEISLAHSIAVNECRNCKKPMYET